MESISPTTAYLTLLILLQMLALFAMACGVFNFRTAKQKAYHTSPRRNLH